MKAFHAEHERLLKARSIVDAVWPWFGINKRREITRLLYEISKRERLRPDRLPLSSSKDYTVIKNALIEKRYPKKSRAIASGDVFLPKLEFCADERALIEKTSDYYPKTVLIEKRAWKSSVAKRARRIFSGAEIRAISHQKKINTCGERFDLNAYNRRRDTLVIGYERYGVSKSCPCAKFARGCGYHLINIGFGCPYECTYCFLQEYTNSGGLFLTANPEACLKDLPATGNTRIRIGTGEFSDSLALDPVSEYSALLCGFFMKRSRYLFEFKTKSDHIANILSSKASPNLVVSWSLNPQKIIDENEAMTAPLSKRLQAARRCVDAGFRVGFHLDPVIYRRDWARSYEDLIKDLFDQIPSEAVAWISLGALRLRPGLKNIIERRFPENTILDQELFIGFDGKLRYTPGLRRTIYVRIKSFIRSRSPKTPVYVCMEEADMWKSLGWGMPDWK